MSADGLLSKFRGCMIGGLVGDCVGFPFELIFSISESVLVNYFSSLLTGDSIEILQYTDDTSMALSIASSLIEYKEVNAKDLAKRFVHEYYQQTSQKDRGYGIHVRTVLHALKYSNYEDVFQPAKMQFDGSGSYGNGSAMRIAPIALFRHDKSDEILKNDVDVSSRITHTHPYGINGAILQALAVKAALKLDASKELDPVEFITELEKKMADIELKDDRPYCESLKKIKDIYLQKQEDIITPSEIGKCLGNDETAHKTVPTAIYSFLKGLKPLPEFECTNPFVRTIYFAISVGGDTDTIACMAGNIAGAYYGIEIIPEKLQKRCEQIEYIKKLVDQLYKASHD